MVVGVAHGPAGGVLLGLLAVDRVDEATVAVGPVLVQVQAPTGLLEQKHILVKTTACT